jgi:hypothetical protein
MLRRNFLKLASLVPFISIPKVYAFSAKPEYIASCTIIFDDGDKVVLYLTKTEDGFAATENSMNHASCDIVTTFVIDKEFTLGKLDYFPDKNTIRVHYKGYDKNGNLVYQNEGSQKIWRELASPTL